MPRKQKTNRIIKQRNVWIETYKDLTTFSGKTRAIKFFDIRKKRR